LVLLETLLQVTSNTTVGQVGEHSHVIDSGLGNERLQGKGNSEGQRKSIEVAEKQREKSDSKGNSIDVCENAGKAKILRQTR
jgi:hypothetical protein